MNTHSVSLVITDANKTTMTYHYIPIRVDKIQTTDKTKFWQECRTPGTQNAGGDVKYTTFLEINLAVSYKVKHIVPFDPAVLLLGIYSRDRKIYVHIKTSI